MKLKIQPQNPASKLLYQLCVQFYSDFWNQFAGYIGPYFGGQLWHHLTKNQAPNYLQNAAKTRYLSQWNGKYSHRITPTYLICFMIKFVPNLYGAMTNSTDCLVVCWMNICGTGLKIGCLLWVKPMRPKIQYQPTWTIKGKVPDYIWMELLSGTTINNLWDQLRIQLWDQLQGQIRNQFNETN